MPAFQLARWAALRARGCLPRRRARRGPEATAAAGALLAGAQRWLERTGGGGGGGGRGAGRPN